MTKTNTTESIVAVIGMYTRFRKEVLTLCVEGGTEADSLFAAAARSDRRMKELISQDPHVAKAVKELLFEAVGQTFERRKVQDVAPYKTDENVTTVDSVARVE